MGQGPRWHNFVELPREGDRVILRKYNGEETLLVWENHPRQWEYFTTEFWYGPIPSPDAAPAVEKKFEMVPCSHCSGAGWAGDTPCISCDNRGYTLVEKIQPPAEPYYMLGVPIKEVFNQLNVPHEVNGFIPCPVCKDWVVKRGGPDDDSIKCTACGDTGWARGPAIRDCLTPHRLIMWVTCPTCKDEDSFHSGCPTCGDTRLVIGTTGAVVPPLGVATEDSK